MVNIYVLEDAYALYDNERPAPSKRVRNEIRSDKNARSETRQSDRTKMPGHGGQKSPVMEDKNVLLLNTPENKKENRKEILPSAFEDKEPEQTISNTDPLEALPPEHYRQLESAARSRLIGRTKFGNPTLKPLIEGRGKAQVREEMRTMLVAGWTLQAEESVDAAKKAGKPDAT